MPLGSPKLVGEPAGDCSPITIGGIRTAAGSSGRRISLGKPALRWPQAALPTAAQRRSSTGSCLNAAAPVSLQSICARPDRPPGSLSGGTSLRWVALLHPSSLLTGLRRTPSQAHGHPLPPVPGPSACWTSPWDMASWPSPKGWGAPTPCAEPVRAPSTHETHAGPAGAHKAWQPWAARMLHGCSRPWARRGQPGADQAQHRPRAHTVTRSPAMGSTESPGQARHRPRLHCPQPLPRGARVYSAVLPLPWGREVLLRRTEILPAAMSCHLRFC